MMLDSLIKACALQLLTVVTFVVRGVGNSLTQFGFSKSAAISRML